jgi:hypothetical protein
LVWSLASDSLPVVRYVYDLYPKAIRKGNDYSTTVLHKAVENGNVEIVEFIVSKMRKKDLEKRRGMGESALDLAEYEYSKSRNRKMYFIVQLIRKALNGPKIKSK